MRTSTISSSTISLTMCRTECIGSDMTFTLAVTDMPVVPTSSSTSSRRYVTQMLTLFVSSTSFEPCTLAVSYGEEECGEVPDPRRRRRIACGRG